MPNHHNNKFSISSKTVAPTKKIAVLDSYGKDDELLKGRLHGHLIAGI